MLTMSAALKYRGGNPRINSVLLSASVDAREAAQSQQGSWLGKS